MASTGKQTPLGVNVNSSVLQNIGFHINPVAAGYMGASRVNTEYSFGSLVQGTVLRLLTWAIHDGYNRGPGGSAATLTTSTYNNLITIGQGVLESMGNSKPPTYQAVDPSGRWTAAGTPATTTYPISGNTGQGQSASWIPYLMTNPNHSVTQWGFIRCWALQAWNEFNYNGVPTGSGMPEYKDFTSSFLSSDSFVNFSNVSINAMQNSKTFLKGTFSNADDLMTGDIAGVTLATKIFGQDCIALGKAIDLSSIQTFGMPSGLLINLKKNNVLTQSLSLALLSAGLTVEDIDNITNSVVAPTKTQEQQIYGAFLIIMGQDLQDILVVLNCKTQNLETLADLLNIKKLFPNSYKSLTVPVYNTNPGPTNSKTYYPIYEGNNTNVRLESPVIAEQIGTVVPPIDPPIVEPATPALSVTTVIENKPIEVTTAQVIASVSTEEVRQIIEAIAPIIPVTDVAPQDVPGRSGGSASILERNDQLVQK
jgi:hypothetical protein